MPSFTHTDWSPHSIEELVSLVLDIEKYPEFLPWCTEGRILSREPGKMTADMAITFAGLSQKYTSEITIENIEHGVSIHVVAASGPFKHLNNYWRFIKKDDGTQIEFSIDFAFKSKMLDLMLGAMFSATCGHMIGAFEKRADELFGKTQEYKS